MLPNSKTHISLGTGLFATGLVLALAGSAWAQPPWPAGSLETVLYTPASGAAIGSKGLHVADLDGDGVDEIVATTSRWITTWFIYEQVGGTYTQSWAAPPLENSLSALTVANIDRDPAPEVLVASGQEILIYDGATRRLQRRFDVPLTGEIEVLAAADLNRRGAPEIICGDRSSLLLLSARGKVRREVAGLGTVRDLAIGQVDSDQALELVVAAGMGYVIDGVTGAVEWRRSAGFGQELDVADIDRDGIDEIVGASWTIEAWDADKRKLRYSRATDGRVLALGIADIDGDGRLEIVTSGESALQVWRASNGVRRWKVWEPGMKLTAMSFGNSDGDPALEIVGGNYSQPRRLYAIDGRKRRLEWKSDVFGPFFSGFDAGPMGPAAAPAAFLGGNWDGWSSLLFMDFESRHVEPVLLFPEGPMVFVSADLDDDPQPELVVSRTNRYGEHGLVAVDSLTIDLQWEENLAEDLPQYSSLAAGDVDGDGHLEIVAAAGTRTTPVEPSFIDVRDARTGELEWRQELSPRQYRRLELIRIAEVDGDPNPEIVVAERHGPVYVLSADQRRLDLQSRSYVSAALDTVDLDGDGIDEIVLGGQELADSFYGRHLLRVVDPISGEVAAELLELPGAISGLAFHDYTRDGEPDAVVFAAERVGVFDLHGGQSAASWYLGRRSESDSIRLRQIDGRGQPEILVGRVNGFAVLRYRRTPSPWRR